MLNQQPISATVRPEAIEVDPRGLVDDSASPTCPLSISSIQNAPPYTHLVSRLPFKLQLHHRAPCRLADKVRINPVEHRHACFWVGGWPSKIDAPACQHAYQPPPVDRRPQIRQFGAGGWRRRLHLYRWLHIGFLLGTAATNGRPGATEKKL